MVLLIDTNVLLDVLQEREPYFANSLKIWGLCEDRYIEDKYIYVKGYISSVSMTNISYVMRKQLTPDRTMEIFMALALAFEFVDLQMTDLETAADMKWRDFEDAVQSATASRIHADYIITRNTKDYHITPEEYFMNVFDPEQ